MEKKNTTLLSHLIYSFYERNRNNLIGKTMRSLKYNLNYFRKRRSLGTKEDLKYIEPGRGPFDKTKRIAIELSNICNYATLHKRCPLNQVKEYKILPEKIVYHVLETGKKYDFRGYIAFDIYNEPGIDPRLMMFIKKTREMLPKAKILLQTNGFYFDQTLAEEFEKNGVDIIRISAYTPEEGERLSKIKLKIPIIVTPIVLDNRLERYSLPEVECNKPCYAPLNELIITYEGRISLCCKEWRRQYTFGDLNKQSLEEVLKSKEIRQVYDRLSKGDRFLDVCRRCTESR